jgi:hypothetical protein
MTTSTNETVPTWAQFQQKYNWGQGFNEQRKESKKKLKGTANNHDKKKENQARTTEWQQIAIDGENI